MIFCTHIVLQTFHIDGQSMEPTLHDQEYVFVFKAAYLFSAPQRGDIIVFQYPLNPRENYIKRIIAVPGDVISIVGQTITVNGITLHEPYINRTNMDNPYPSIEKRLVGPDEYFVLGDNRGNSSDSRQWGFVPRNNILGKALCIYWPINEDNLGFLPDASSVFANTNW
jgi:signal peptidase I